MKKCSICLEEKPLSFFWKSKITKDGYLGRCKLCATRKKATWSKEREKKPSVVYKKYRKDAKRRDLEFQLTEKEFFSFQNSKCHYCGVALDRIRLDRIDNQKGYFIDNVVSCCSNCNNLKGSIEVDDFLEHINKICLYQKEKQNG